MEDQNLCIIESWQFTLNDYTHKWAGGEKDAEIIFSKLNNSEIDFLHVTKYHADAPAFYDKGPSMASLAKNWTNVPVFANSNLNTPDLAEQVISNSEIDVVAIGKVALANKEWRVKALGGKEVVVVMLHAYHDQPYFLF